MSKLKEYFERKRIEELGLPKIYIVKSTPSGVDEPIELQVIDIQNNTSIEMPSKIPYNRYCIKESPFQLEIKQGNTSGQDVGYGSGFGDLWSWTYFGSLSKEEAWEYFEKESKRINEKYKQPKYETWDEIFELQGRTDGANYHLLKDWLKTNFEVPKKKGSL